MRLSRYDLVHATDKQLTAIGVVRKQNAGWLKAAIRQEFTPAQVIAFEAIGQQRRRRGKVIPYREAELFPDAPKETAEDFANAIYLANRDEF